MRKLRQLSMVVVLTLAAATYSFAGIIGTGPEPPPPPPDSTASSTTASSTMASVVLTLIQTALSVR